jgi:RsiW-degrading membrane proteinase PrsW (M82 family)
MVMDGLWVLLLLIFIAALPVVPVYVWFRVRQFPIPPVWFLLSLLAGAFSLLIAALIQGFFSMVLNTRGSLLFNIFIRIALTEETGRLLMLCFLFWLETRIRNMAFHVPAYDAPSLGPAAFGVATGLLTGLGFAIIESASYGAVDISIALLRAFTAAPLHGACGARVGYGVIIFKHAPYRGLWRFLSAVAIHGMYNLMVINPGIPPFLPVLIALSALASSTRLLSKSRQ